MGLQPNLDGLRLSLVAEKLDFLVDKSSKVLNGVENRFKLELNSWSPFVDRLFWQTQTKSNLGRSATRLFSSLLLPRFPLS